MGLEVSLIAGVVIAVIVVIGVVLYAILDRTGFIAKWSKGKKAVTDNKFPCIQSSDCGSLYGLDHNHVCDPKLKQCRIRSYIGRSCSKDSDCLEATPFCLASPVLQVGLMCSVKPYDFGNLYGDPTRLLSTGQCLSGLTPSNTWNFCQIDLSGPCKTSDDCYQGACVNSHCQFLGDYDVCTVGSSYGEVQCQLSQYCAEDPKHRLAALHCQPNGIVPHQAGAFCLVDSDCDNKDCYREFPDQKVGQCASHSGLIGMTCRTSAECAQSLICDIKSGDTQGTCNFSDPAAQSNQKDLTHCPVGQYSAISANGCVGASSPVPCSNGFTCSFGCAIGILASLVLASLNADQTWNLIYPVSGLDIFDVFTGAFTLAPDNKTVLLNQNSTLLISPSQLEGSRAETYPTITLNPAGTGPVQSIIQDSRSCQQMLSGINLFSLFSNQRNSNILFDVKYDPNNLAASSVSAILIGSRIANGNPTRIFMPDDTLFASYYQDADPSLHAPPTQIYVNCNYHGRRTLKNWNISAGDHPLPAAWSGASNVWLCPPPLLPANIDHTAPSPYLDKCLRFGEDDPKSVEPVQVFVHFFYHKSPGEQVISWRFNVLPTQSAGAGAAQIPASSGVNTLVGLFEVERPGLGRRLVISTLSLYLMGPIEAQETSTFAVLDKNDATSNMYAIRTPVFTDTVTNLNVYSSIYSFVLIDFETSWPFTTKLIGPAPTMSDTAGLCNVVFGDSMHGTTTVSTLAERGDLIPGYNGYYPVFTPRAYTRVQAATTIRTQEWSSTTLFGTKTPSLLDSDMVLIATAGASSIVGLTLTYSHAPVAGGTALPQTIMLTMRFGDCMPTSRYSIPNLSAMTVGGAARTRMYGFYLSPEPEETGGGIVAYPFGKVIKEAFPPVQTALTPINTQDISSWDTAQFPSLLGPPVPKYLVDGEAKYVYHQMRTSWGSEVFTACLVPSNIIPPIRFFRMPSDNVSLNGSDDLWIWGRDFEDQLAMRCIPVFFDNLGIVLATMTGKPDPYWTSTAVTTCPPTAVTTVIGQDHQYFLQGSLPNFHVFSQPDPWNISPVAVITLDKSQTALDLTGRMCQTQGYQDGLLYRARPYIFAASNDPQNLPYDVANILNDPAQNAIRPDNLESMAVSLASDSTHPYQDAIAKIGVGSIATLLGSTGSVHPSLPAFFKDGFQIVWVGSESIVPLLPGGYRTTACPVNVKANPITTTSTYPTQCVDYPLTQESTERKPLAICVVYRSIDGPQALEMHLYNIRMSGSTVTLVNDILVQTNGALPHMAMPYVEVSTPSGSWGGYPGFNGGPALIYTPCE